MLGGTGETGNKEPNQFQKAGWIELKRGAVIITDMAALKKFE